jgi:hypothetical protein
METSLIAVKSSLSITSSVGKTSLSVSGASASCPSTSETSPSATASK